MSSLPKNCFYHHKVASWIWHKTPVSGQRPTCKSTDGLQKESQLLELLDHAGWLSGSKISQSIGFHQRRSELHSQPHLLPVETRSQRVRTATQFTSIIIKEEYSLDARDWDSGPGRRKSPGLMHIISYNPPPLPSKEKGPWFLFLWNKNDRWHMTAELNGFCVLDQFQKLLTFQLFSALPLLPYLPIPFLFI